MSTPPVGPPLPGVTAVEVDGRISAYSPTTTQLVALNETASDVWRLCDGEHSVDGIIERLAASYSVEAGAIAEDVRAVIGELVALRLLDGTGCD